VNEEQKERVTELRLLERGVMFYNTEYWPEVAIYSCKSYRKT